MAKNELDWEHYEAITKYIYASLGVQYGIKVIGYGRKFRVKGKSGVHHQVDVLTEQSNCEGQLLTAIECKYWNRKVNKDVVMKLSKIMEDSDITSGIIVCKAGFTPDSQTFAEHEGIKLVELREAEENDGEFQKTMEIGTLDIHFNIEVLRGNVTSIDLGSSIIASEREIMAMYYAELYDLEGRKIPFVNYLKEFSEEMQRRGKLLRTDTIVYPVSSPLFLKLADKEVSVEKIAITGFLMKIDSQSKKSFSLTDQVWLIMKELFSTRKLALSKSGLIWNLPST
ncbi:MULTISPECIES: restriction endonuclease [unclassified Allomuricauda]|jgi:hypothetical protein|uniref:restriction endonuclease n=1 Tax=unclassified Allomuricauda TaxID=2615049 RepID=UPI00082A8BA2|nr:MULTISPECIES: restriction endonuclease [unclassified Allomuricauda]MCK0160095.1 restriction endonuclease [Muricauda sp. F6463D]